MAVVKLGRPVKSNLGGSNGAMAYIIDPAKTDGGRLVSSNYERTGTDYDALTDPMLEDNENSPKGIRKNSRLAYHIKLSFSPDDPVTPEKVHELGVEFAHRITSDEYKFVVATHTDRHHLHDHIMVCAASRYGKHLKAELPKDIIEQWRAVSDEICRREGLSVVFNPVVEEQTRKMRDGATAGGDDGTPPARDPKYDDEAPVRSVNEPEATARKASGGEPLERRYGMSMEEIYASAKGMGTKDRIRMLIDLTSSTAENFEDWKDMLDIRGVDVTIRGQHLTYTLKDTGFKVRDAKLGQAYDMTNIMAGLPQAIFSSTEGNAGGIITMVIICAIILLVIPLIVFLERGQRRIPVSYAKRVVGRRMMGGQTTYLPIKVNTAGVVPIIFASALLYFPAQIAVFFPGIGWIQAVASALSTGWLNWVLNVVLIVFFAYFYTSMVFNPDDTADNLKKQGGFIPGVRPGRATAAYIKNALNKITLPSAVFLALIAIVPSIIFSFTGNQLIQAFGGTSILIMVGVVLDTVDKLEGQIKMYDYDGFFK